MCSQGWTYGLDGVLLKATRITGIKNFNKDVCRVIALISFIICSSPDLKLTKMLDSVNGGQEFGLIPLSVASWGPFVLINLDKDTVPQQNFANNLVHNEWLGSASDILSNDGIDSSLKHLCRHEYTIRCNWKVLFFVNSLLHL